MSVSALTTPGSAGRCGWTWRSELCCTTHASFGSGTSSGQGLSSEPAHVSTGLERSRCNYRCVVNESRPQWMAEVRGCSEMVDHIDQIFAEPKKSKHGPNTDDKKDVEDDYTQDERFSLSSFQPGQRDTPTDVVTVHTSVKTCCVSGPGPVFSLSKWFKVWCTRWNR